MTRLLSRDPDTRVFAAQANDLPLSAKSWFLRVRGRWARNRAQMTRNTLAPLARSRT